jgi:hypothetical protein
MGDTRTYSAARYPSPGGWSQIKLPWVTRTSYEPTPESRIPATELESQLGSDSHLLRRQISHSEEPELTHRSHSQPPWSNPGSQNLYHVHGATISMRGPLAPPPEVSRKPELTTRATRTPREPTLGATCLLQSYNVYHGAPISTREPLAPHPEPYWRTRDLTNGAKLVHCGHL